MSGSLAYYVIARREAIRQVIKPDDFREGIISKQLCSVRFYAIYL